MSTLEAYHSARNALIADDLRHRREYLGDASRSSLSDKEKEADAVLRAIRAEEAESVWKREYEGVPHPFPGMEFLTGKKIIEKTKLFKILSKMPKGALLHSHLDATVNTKVLLSLAYKEPAIHVRIPSVPITPPNAPVVEKTETWTYPICPASLTRTLPEFCPLTLAAASLVTKTSLTSEDYKLGEWVPINTARDNFSPELGGPEGFDKWVIDSMMISPVEAYETHKTVTLIWQKFASVFQVSTGLIRYVPIFAEYIREFLRTSVEDGISYIEARINFLPHFMIGADGQDNVPHREWLVMFEQAIKDVKAELSAQGRDGEFLGAKVIYSTIRFITPEELEWYLEDCISLKKEFPDLIAGFDLVGDENVLKPLIYYIEPLLRFKERQKEEGVEIPFIFHAGETFGDGTEADVNLYDAILLGTKRIGHGFSLIKHPKLVETCREKGIAVEVCPISYVFHVPYVRSRSPSDSDQKHNKRVNTGAPHTHSTTTSSNSEPHIIMAPAHPNDTNSSTPNSSRGVKKEDDHDSKTSNSNDKRDSKDLSASATTSADPSSSSTAAAAPSANIHMRCLIVTQDASIIIGKGGSHVNEIREKSGARVMVSESIPGNPERILNVSGPLDAVSKAFGLIVRRINDEPFDVPSVPGSRAVTIKFMIPNSRMGSVIGKGGSKIKEIQDASGARLNASEGMLPGSTERVLSVAGVADAIHIATYYIGNILIEAQEKMPSHNNSSYRPGGGSSRSGSGRGGMSGGSSYVPGYSSGSSYQPHPAGPPAHISHNPHNPHNPPQQLQTQQIFIPNDLVGCIIGKGGSKINEIRHMSASQIKIMEPGATGTSVGGAPAPVGGEGERLVVITGQPANIQMAVQLLYHRLEQEKQKQLRAATSS
ncbi:hypothetical protein CVT24_009241 [Panaeolus cyanescens]|uniref:K Homology domain-containing protein n=1 Tax=Panaeolus cyanescens TaxID=181874 RepID=A0A409Y807_9AGAR|nr:hypothetical protein CVT24_009241 [Panaeolus cyanescens]